MYLYKNGLLPDSFIDMFLLHSDVHSFYTRSKNSFRLPHCGTNVKKFSLRFQGPKLYHSFSPDVQNAPSFAVFTSKLKIYLLIQEHFTPFSVLECVFFFFFFSFSLFYPNSMIFSYIRNIYIIR